MKVEGRMFLGLGAFLVPISVLYTIWSDDRAGAVMLFAVAVGLVLLGGWVLVTARHERPRPEDRPDARPDDPDAAVVDLLPAASGWPAVLAAGTVVAALGLAFNVWLALPGAALLGLGVVGFARQASSWPPPVDDTAAHGGPPEGQASS